MGVFDNNPGEWDRLSRDDDAFLSLPGTEAIVAGLWKAALRLPQVGLDEDLFELDVTPLLAAELLARINRTFEQELTIDILFKHPTVRAMAGLLHDISSQHKSTALEEEQKVTIQGTGQT